MGWRGTCLTPLAEKQGAGEQREGGKGGDVQRKTPCSPPHRSAMAQPSSWMQKSVSTEPYLPERICGACLRNWQAVVANGGAFVLRGAWRGGGCVARAIFHFPRFLGVRGVVQEEIRRGYLRCARKCHPDKNPDEDAKAQFQQLQRIYAVLSKPESRALYDELGDTTEEDGIDGRFGAAPISEEDINAFAREYLGSEVEKEDLVHNYLHCKGRMEKVFEVQILSDLKYDTHRFVDILDEAISAGDARSYKSYQMWRERILKTHRRKDSLMARFKKSKSAVAEMEEMALIEKIKDRGAKHMAFVNDLKTRFCGSGPTPYDEITEEEFQDAQSRLMNNSPKKRKTSKKVKGTKKGGVQKRRSARLANRQNLL